MTIPMISLKAFRYGGKSLKPDVQFHAETRKDAKVLKLMGKARPGVLMAMPKAPPARKAADVPHRAVMQPATPAAAPAPKVDAMAAPAAAPPASSALTPKEEPAATAARTYRRRDLTAEGGGSGK